MDELVMSVFRPEATAAVQAIIERLKQTGCDGVILDDGESPLPTLDSTRLPARAAPARAIEDGATE